MTPVVINVLAVGTYVIGWIAILIASDSKFTAGFAIYLCFAGILYCLVLRLGGETSRNARMLFALRVKIAGEKQHLAGVVCDSKQKIYVYQKPDIRKDIIWVALELVVEDADKFYLVVKAAPEAGPATMEQIRGLAKAV